MNTLWLKIASGAIAILIIVVLVSMFMPGGDKQPTQQTNEPGGPTTFQGQVEQDRRELLPTRQEEEAIANQTPENVVQQPNEPAQTATNVTPPAPAGQPVPTQPKPTEITIYVKKLADFEQTAAEQQINWEVTAFDTGRLPMTSYKPSIDSARRILNMWPDSIYAYKAKLMLAKIPERYRQQYNITAQELDTSKFLTPRAGTVPVKVTIEEQ